MKYCFLDLETTGFEPSKDSIIECSFIIIDDGVETERYDKVFQPDKSPLNEFVSNLTGITQQELDQDGLTFAHQKDIIESLIGDSIIVGHNIDFDINFLVGNDIDLSKNKRIDTHELARIVLPLESSYALEVITQKYGFTHENAHRAMSDVEGCAKFFDFLTDKIEGLPKGYLESIKGFLETKTEWAAKALFLESEGSNQDPEKVESTTPLKTEEESIFEGTDNQIANTKFSNKTIESLTAAAQNSETKSVIITPRVNRFDHLAKFPTPEVILDPEKLAQFSENREVLSDQETTFFLKLKYRNYLGYRGLFFCDLFFKERECWNEVHTQETTDIFQAVLSEKAAEKVLVASPEAYLRFIEKDVFAQRVVIIDEGELVAKSLLFAPAKTFSLQPFLNHYDDQIATTTQFTVSNICRDFIEKKLGHEIGHFPQKMLLDAHDDIKHFIAELSQNVDHPDWAFWHEILSNPPAQSVRWLNYHPDSGNLTFGCWHPDDWRHLKDKLCEKTVWLTCRSKGPDSQQFFNTFTGLKALKDVTKSPEDKKPKLIIPQDLVSPKSPDFNAFTAKQILETFEKTSGNLAVNFSSLDSLRNVYDTLKTTLKDEDVFVIGEKVNGGSGKVIEMLKNQQKSRIIFCYQRLDHPDLSNWTFENLIFQKFPFAPPEPLLDKFKLTMQQNGQSFWDIWMMTHIQADISRRIDVLKGVKNVYFIDSRENAAWGKKVLKYVFE